MVLKYPNLKEGAPLEILNSDYFTTQPRYVGQTAYFIRYATEEELERGAGPYLIKLPTGNSFAALETEIMPIMEAGDAVVFDEAAW